jgi:hypothetical protein
VGDGETFEDVLASVLTAEGALHCPVCGKPAPLCEESLSRAELETLARW